MSFAREYMVEFLPVTLGTKNVELIQSMIQQGIRHAVCVDANSHVKGVVTATDVIRELEHDIASTRILEGVVEHIMSDEVHYVTEDAILIEVARKMARHHLEFVVVLRGLQPLGIIQQTDLLRWWHKDLNDGKSK